MISLSLTHHKYKWKNFNLISYATYKEQYRQHNPFLQLHKCHLYTEQKTAVLKQNPGGRLNKKDGLTRYGNSHVKDKTS